MSRLVLLLSAALAPAGAAQGPPAAGPPPGTVFAGRAGAAKERLLRDLGGSKETELAAARGLAWLAKQQKADGSWAFDGTSKDEVVAATGMCLLPFLAAGETHQAGQKYQKAVAAGVAFLVKRCPVKGPDVGVMSPNAYAQAIAALALCEAYGMTRDKDLLAPAQAAANAIQKAQGPNGSWGYAARTPSNGDTSITGWQVQALKAAQHAKDIVVDRDVLKKAVGFLDFAGVDPATNDPKSTRKSAYGYADGARARPDSALTAAGLLCRYTIDGWGPDNAGMQAGVLGLTKRGPAAGGKLDTYFLHYATPLVRFFDGDEWKEWNEGKKGPDGTRKGGLRDLLTGLQVKKDGVNLGSWDPDAGQIGSHCGRLGTTALCVLNLQVYYRNLPLYKRAAGDEAIKILDPAK
jgi:hypothetical protein